jgi:hypothetical protein
MSDNRGKEEKFFLSLSGIEPRDKPAQPLYRLGHPGFHYQGRGRTK